MTAPVTRDVGPEDRPRPRPFDRERLVELAWPAVASAAGVWVLFHLAGLNAPFGYVVVWFAVFVAIYAVIIRRRHGVIELKDHLATVIITAATVVALIPLVLILYYVVNKGGSVLFNHFPSFGFIRRSIVDFGPSDPISKAGMAEAVVGTLEQVGLVTLLTVPIGVLAATYINEVGGRYASVVRAVADGMTGLPTIIAGLFVYSFWIYGHTSRYSGIAAVMALSVVMLPIVVRTSEEVLRIVSDSLREAALALGAPDWRMILQVVIPTARTGLVTAVLLGVARAAGETAPVLLVAFGNKSMNVNPLHGAQDDLPFRIYELIFSPNAKDVQVAWGGALLLLLIILTLFTLARILGTGGPSKRQRTSLLARLRSR